MVLKVLLACCFATCSRGYVSQQAGPVHPTPPTGAVPPHLRYMGLYVCTHTGSPLPPGAPALANCLDGDLEELSGWVNLAFSRNATTLRKARRLGMHTLLSVDHGAAGLFCPAPPSTTGAHVILCPNWRSVIASIKSEFGAQLASGELDGLWLGDEIEAPFKNWTSVLRALRKSLGPKPLLYTNEDRLFEGTGCDFPGAALQQRQRTRHLVCEECRWPSIPPELSFVSIDSCESTPAPFARLAAAMTFLRAVQTPTGQAKSTSSATT